MSTPSATDRDPREDRVRDLDAQRRAFLLAHPGTHTRMFSDEDVAFLLGLVTTLRAERDRLLAEAERLKAGRFTPQELQDLCHNLGGEDACAFKAGCEEYQRRLFGTGAIADEREACARIAESACDVYNLGNRIAADIRARGQS